MKRILITILFGFIAAQNTLYCDICTNHIACRNNASFSVKCPSNAKMIELSKDEIEIILDVHNSLRNTIASGKVFLTLFVITFRIQFYNWRIATWFPRSCTDGNDGKVQ